MDHILKALLVEPGQYPKPVEIENTLESLQKQVGGDIEVVYPWEDRACIICDEEGKLKGRPLNRLLDEYDVLAGSFLICGVGEEDFCNLTPEQMKYYEEKYHNPEMFYRDSSGLYSRSCTPAQYRQFEKFCKARTEADREER